LRALQVNTTVNTGSTGRIAEGIGNAIISNGGESYIAFGRGPSVSRSKLIRIGDSVSMYLHGLRSLFLDQHGAGSSFPTQSFVRKIREIEPSIIGLHNIHGYFLNSGVLFSYLRSAEIPVVWTLHDCWAFTGHCAQFDFVGCRKWETHCERCPLTGRYPKSFGYDNSSENFYRKRDQFTGIKNLTIVTPSEWLKRMVQKSFLAEYDIRVINNGVDVDVFKVTTHHRRGDEKKIVLGVASTWDRIKGLTDFIELRKLLPDDVLIVLLGLNPAQSRRLPEGITGVSRTENVFELVEWYNRADVFVNPTYVDTFPTTNLEALACGTPVITYDAGGSAESVDKETGLIVGKSNVAELKSAIEAILSRGKSTFSSACRSKAERKYSKDDRFSDYYRLYRAKVNAT